MAPPRAREPTSTARPAAGVSERTSCGEDWNVREESEVYMCCVGSGRRMGVALYDVNAGSLQVRPRTQPAHTHHIAPLKRLERLAGRPCARRQVGVGVQGSWELVRGSWLV
jgi:hypothetical protein